MSDWIGISLQLVITLEYKDANLPFHLLAIEGKDLLGLINKGTFTVNSRLADTPLIRTAA